MKAQPSDGQEVAKYGAARRWFGWAGGFRPRQDISHRFIAYLMVLSVLPLLALGVASYEISRSALETEAKLRLSQLLQERKRFFDLQSTQVESLLANIASVEAIVAGVSAVAAAPTDSYSRLVTHSRIADILTGYANVDGLVSIDLFSLGNPDAHYHVGDTLDPGAPRREILDRLRAGATRGPGPVYWAGIIDNVNSRSPHSRVVTAARLIYGFPNGSQRVPVGLLVVNHSVEHLQEQFGRMGPDEVLRLALIDHNGRVVSHSDVREVGTRLDSKLFSRLADDAGHLLWGEARALSYLRSRPSGWLLVGEIPLAATSARAQAIGETTALVALLCLVVVGVAAASYSHTVVGPLRRITEHFKSLQRDRSALPGRLPVRGNDDIAELTAWFNAFVEGLREQERAAQTLQASEARFRTLFEDAGIGMAVIAGDGEFVLVNRTFSQMVGRAEDELLSMRFGELLHAEDTHDGAHGHRRYDVRLMRRDRSVLWGRITEAPLPRAPHDAPGGDQMIVAVEDITAQKQADGERRARVAAEAANEAKSLFLAKMSHELRTPLNAVLGYARLLQRDSGLSQREGVALESIHGNAEHLLALINDLLDLAKVEAGRLELCPERMDLPAMLRSVTDITRVTSDRKGLRFECDCSEHLPQWVHADEKRLRQVLLNLLGNATKFTDSGQVVLKVELSGADNGTPHVRFEVQDSGIGIAQDQLESIFQPFEQAGDLARRTRGAGLGLAISRQLVRLMGGDIHVESKARHGSRFWFDVGLPIARAEPAHAPAAQRITGYQGERKTVLVVDDVPVNRMLVIDYLTPYGFEVIEAEDGLQGLEKVRASRPDVVLMDTVMPRMDGLEATRRLRLLAGADELPVIAMSAGASNAESSRSIDAGANAVCPKPIDVDLLLQQLGALLKLTWTFAPNQARA